MAKKQIQQDSNTFKTILELIKKHKIKSTVLTIVLILVLFPALILLYQSFKMSTSYDSYDLGMAPSNDSKELPDSTYNMYDSAPDQASNELPGIKVIEASAVIETNDAKKEELGMRDLADKYQGYAEESRLSKDQRLVRIDMTLRIPSNNFEEFFNELRENHELESFSVVDYRIDVEQRETQLNTLQRTIEMYSEMLSEVKTMMIGHERIDLTKKLTDQKMNLRNQENNLLNSLQLSKRQSDYSTVRLVIKQSISPKIWPENIGDGFRENMQRSLNKVVSSLTSVLGDLMIILTTVVIWILYVIATILPIWITYRLLKKVYLHTYRKHEDR